MRILLILLFLLSTIAHAEVYQRINPDGSVEFTDVPSQKEDKPVPLRPMSTFTPPPLPPPTTASPPVQTQQTRYTDLRISHPANEATLRNNSGTIKVSVSLSPPLQTGHRLILLLDGTPQGEFKGNSFTLDNVDRGEHTLSAQVVDTEGKILISAPAITVYLHRFSVIHPKSAN